MRKKYISPEFELLEIKLSPDILGDSKGESSDNPHIGDSSEGGEFGGGSWDLLP